MPNSRFGDFLLLAAEICDMPMAMVTSFDGEQLRLVCEHGLHDVHPLTFCEHAVQQDAMLEVPDAMADPRFAALPEVAAGRIRFYVGAPLVGPSGQRLGTLALLDSRPRTLEEAQRKRIGIFAHQVMVNFELQRQRRELEQLADQLARTNATLLEQANHLKQAQQIARVGSWQYMLDDHKLTLSDQVLIMYGITREQFGGTLEDFINLVHPEDRHLIGPAAEAAARTGHANVQCRVVRSDGVVLTVEIIGQLFCDLHGRQYLAGTTQDITDKKATEDKIRQLAYYDHLTGLPNRQFVVDRIDRVVSMRRRVEYDGAVLFIDLDNFKILNDTYGHDYGDLLLKQVAQRLLACVRHYDCVGRFGGDEFVVLLENIGEGGVGGGTHALHVAEKILAALNVPYQLDTLVHRSSPSIGIAFIDGELISTNELLKRADMAMYRAKSEGRNAIRFFNPAMQEAVHARAELEADLRQALAEQALYLEYQPQVDREGRITGAEALLRWRHWRRGLVPPERFLPLAEELGLIMEIGNWLFGEACRQLERWSRNPATRRLSISVNISAQQFRHPAFVDQVLGALASSRADPALLNLEITESMLLKDFDDVCSKMMALKEHGVRFALDDFGTGYSSLAYLQRLPLDQLKIDRSFVRDVPTDHNDSMITRSIIGLGQNLGLSVIAEGVETEAQRAFLADEGCDSFQGFLYHLPQSANMLETRLRRPS